MMEILTDELLDNMAEMYQAYKKSMILLDEPYYNFNQYVEVILKHREKKIRKGRLHRVK